MAIEQFMQMHQPGSEMREIVSGVLRGQRINDEPGNRLLALAGMYRNAGRDGLESITKELTDYIGELPNPSEARSLLSFSQSVSMWRNLDAVIIGATIPLIHDTLSSQVVDVSVFTAYYNLSTQGTLIGSADVTHLRNREDLTTPQWLKMVQFFGQDRTMGAFFEPRNIAVLPETLRSIIGTTVLSIESLSERAAFVKQHRLLAASLVT